MEVFDSNNRIVIVFDKDKFSKESADSIVNALTEKLLNTRYSDSAYEFHAIFKEVRARIIEEATNKYLQENCAKIFSELDLKAIMNMVTIKVARGASSELD